MDVPSRLSTTTLILLVFSSPIALGDISCDDKADQVNHQKLKQAEQQEAAGQYKAAYNGVKATLDDSCIKGYLQRRTALLQRTSKLMGDEEAKAKRYRAAYPYYNEGGWKKEAIQSLLQHARAHSKDYSQMDYVSGQLFYQNDTAAQSEFKGIVRQTIADLGKQEEASFAKNQYSTDPLEKLSQWSYLIDDAEAEKVKKLAIRRGDLLRSKPAVAHKEKAMDYYTFSQDEARIDALRKDAFRQAIVEEQKGNFALASRYYALAGEDDKALALGEREQNDTDRRAKFQKEQEELEKELDFD